MLLDLGAHPDGAQDYPKANQLAKAVYKNRWSIVQLLLHRGARVEGEWSETYTRELFDIARYYHMKPYLLDSGVQLRLLKELSSRYPDAASAGDERQMTSRPTFATYNFSMLYPPKPLAIHNSNPHSNIPPYLCNTNPPP